VLPALIRPVSPSTPTQDQPRIESHSLSLSVFSPLPNDNSPKPNLFHPDSFAPAFEDAASPEDAVPVSETASLAFAFARPDLEKLDCLVATGNDQAALFLGSTGPTLALCSTVCLKAVPGSSP